uniref:Hemicentin-1-like n=1 Tax=Saccoglossus kowalevskii TaxID=10224 RepID=A0ABM0M4D4_SACKO
MSGSKLKPKNALCLYRETLSGAEQLRYEAKLSTIGGCDPYVVDATKWSADVALLPSVTYPDIVNYLVFNPSPYTLDDLKCYKGLEAYNQFVSGWVREMKTFVCNENIVVSAKVMHSQRMSEKPLQPWMIAKQNAPPNMEDSHLPNDVKVIQHKPAALECATDANPSPTITWYKNGNRLNPHSRLGPRILRGNTLLQIYSSQVTDIGQYQCVATNVAGNSSKIFNLDVLVPPTIGDGDKYKTVLVNANVTLSCEVYGLPKPKVTWYKDQLKLPAVNKDKKYTIFSSGSLLLSAAKISHTGEYTCHVSNEAGNITRVITLEVQVPPSIEDRIEDIRTIEGDHVDLICRASGTPPPKIIWHRGGNVIDDNTPGYVLHDDGRLSIRSTSVSDAGAYNCVAQNPAGAAYKKIKLQVQVPPTIQESFQQFVVIEDQQVTMECTSTGTPAPEIRWQIKDEDISHNDMRYRMLPTGALQIPFARREDTGMFKCIAENAAGKAEQFMGLQVNVPPSIYPDKQAYHVLIQENIGLQCNSDGTPQPTVTWEKDGRGVANTDRHHIADDGELYITNTQEVDNGKYICRAINVAGRASREMILTVQVPPKFTVMPIAQRLSANDVLHLVCEAVGVPVPELTWQHNGEYIPTARSINGRSELTIYNVRKEDTGTYACIAENAAGKEKRVTDIWVQVPPTDFVPPRNQTVTRAHTVELTCSADGDPAPNIIWSKNSNPVHFTNRVRKSNNGSLVIYGTTVSKPELTIEPPEAMIVDQGDAILIDCQAEGDPQPSIEWWTATSMITSNGRNMILPNNTLYIFPAQIEDNGRYACKAINTVGDTTRATLVTVRVNGQYGRWSEWSECSKSCGRGFKSRDRHCNDPVPQYGGKACTGKSHEQVPCNIKPCPVDGKWGPWSPWNECSETCGEGTETRTRQCNNPAPKDGGLQCLGSDVQSQMCKIQTCSVDGKWGTWNSWQMCSKSCGTGKQTRERTCSNPAPRHGGRPCDGQDKQENYCNTEGCPVHGNWSTWEEWGECSASCNGGQQRRYRTCNNPRPSHGGRFCQGTNTQMKSCNLQECSVDGRWSEWGDWTECSLSCDGGEKTRRRTCTEPSPSYGGRPCQGDSSHVARCNLIPCPDGPADAVGNVIGEINGIDFGIARLYANITRDGNSKRVHAKIYDIPESVGYWMRKLISLLTPIYWTSALEIDEAVNGYTLTNGVFRRETQVEFATGEILTMTHKAHGVDENGQLQIDVVIKGEVPKLPLVDIRLKPYTEDYIQTNNGEIYAYSTRMFSMDGHSLPYAWNHSIHYDPRLGRMPFLVEKLHAVGLGVDYDSSKQVLQYEISTSISKGEPSNQCPEGFYLDASGPFCK